VLGQDHISNTLRNAVVTDTVNHAYLFSGPRGCGKTTSARILAKALNCTDLQGGEPCEKCDSCNQVAAGSSMDVIEMDAASNNGVDAMRDLVSRASLGTSGRRKVYIVDEVHMLSTAASNALLKTLEEPPDHVVFVLATTDPQKVLPTIRSRTQHFEFRLFSVSALVGLLRGVATEAGIDIDDVTIEAVARKGNGSARDALSALDQVIAAGGIEESFDTSELAVALGNRNAGELMIAVDRAVSRGRDPRQLARDLTETLREVFLVHMGVPRSLADDSLVRLLAPAAVTRALELLGEVLVVMRDAIEPRVLLETTLVRLVRPDLDTTPAAVLERLERMERMLANGVPAAMVATSQIVAPVAPVAPPTNAPAASAPVAAPTVSSPEVPVSAGVSAPVASASVAPPSAADAPVAEGSNNVSDAVPASMVSSAATQATAGGDVPIAGATGTSPVPEHSGGSAVLGLVSSADLQALPTPQASRSASVTELHPHPERSNEHPSIAPSRPTLVSANTVEADTMEAAAPESSPEPTRVLPPLSGVPAGNGLPSLKANASAANAAPPPPKKGGAADAARARLSSAPEHQRVSAVTAPPRADATPQVNPLRADNQYADRSVGSAALAEEPTDLRSQVLSELERTNRKARTLLMAGRFMIEEGDALTYGVPNPMHLNRCAEFASDLTAATVTILGRAVIVELVVDPEGASPMSDPEPGDDEASSPLARRGAHLRSVPAPVEDAAAPVVDDTPTPEEDIDLADLTDATDSNAPTPAAAFMKVFPGAEIVPSAPGQ
jgi:DNA polymerase III subunit gamma/tau